jgi:hypothetical protein
VEQEIRKHLLEMIHIETNKIWSCAVEEDYKNVMEHAERLVTLAKHAQEIVEREER